MAPMRAYSDASIFRSIVLPDKTTVAKPTRTERACNAAYAALGAKHAVDSCDYSIASDGHVVRTAYLRRRLSVAPLLHTMRTFDSAEKAAKYMDVHRDDILETHARFGKHAHAAEEVTEVARALGESDPATQVLEALAVRAQRSGGRLLMSRMRECGAAALEATTGMRRRAFVVAVQVGHVVHRILAVCPPTAHGDHPAWREACLLCAGVAAVIVVHAHGRS